MTIDFSKPVLCSGAPCDFVYRKNELAWVEFKNGVSLVVHISCLTNAPEPRVIYLRVWERAGQQVSGSLAILDHAYAGGTDFRIEITDDGQKIERVK